MYHPWLVVCGYNQVPGVNVSENYSLLVKDITFRILLLMIKFGVSAKIVDVKTAFLYGVLE